MPIKGGADVMSQADETIDLGPAVHALPPANTWPALTGSRASHETCAAIGLTPGVPIVMSGHQPWFWHPGILAKRLAARAWSAAHGAQAAWLTVDQDALWPWTLEVPASTSQGVLAAHKVHLASEQPPSPVSEQPAQRVSIDTDALRAKGCSREIAERLEALCAAINVEQAAPSAAMQIERAMRSLTGDALPSISARSLLSLPACRARLEHMLDDPRACCEAYNRAVATHGGARPLAQQGDDWELPLWRIASGRRELVHASDLRTAQSDSSLFDELAPKALLLTALVRLDICDLFIHGLGGGATAGRDGYDRATEAWVQNWLGASLAPAVAVSADLRLQLATTTDAASSLPTRDDLDRAVHRAHTSASNPEHVGDAERSKRKRALVEAIEQSDSRTERARLFREMHDLLDEHQDVHAEALHGLRAHAEDLRQRQGNRAIAMRRDWPWMLYPQSALDALCTQIEAACQASAASQEHRP